MFKTSMLGVAAVALIAASPTVAMAKSIKSLVSDSALSAFCNAEGLGHHMATITTESGTVLTGTVHCETEDLVAGGNDDSSGDEDGNDDSSSDEDSSDDSSSDEDSSDDSSSDEDSSDDSSSDEDSSDDSSSDEDDSDDDSSSDEGSDDDSSSDEDSDEDDDSNS